ncbi:MAG: phage tail tape measure protein [Gammaproteobacteria bacterium]|nr:phage tail tape measure protein [Gammaproteobacteria bacterium]
MIKIPEGDPLQTIIKRDRISRSAHQNRWPCSLSRQADSAIKNLAESNKDFAKAVAEGEMALKGMWSAGQTAIEAQNKLNEALRNPELAISVQRTADVVAAGSIKIKTFFYEALAALQKMDRWRYERLGFYKHEDTLKEDYQYLVASKMPAAIAAQKLKDAQNGPDKYKELLDAANKRDAQAAAAQAAKEAEQAFDDYVKSLQRAYEAQEQWNEIVANAHRSVREMFWDFNDRFDQNLKDSMEAVADSVERTVGVALDGFGEMSIYAEQAARNMQDAFADFLFDPFDRGLKGMLKGFIDVIRRIVAEQTAAKIFGSKKDGGLGLGDIVGGFFGRIFGGKREGGGPVSAGTPYLVGEAGPELFVPARSGSIVPNGAGGTSVTINIDARGATEDAVKMLPAVMKQASDDAVARIRDEVRRGKL